ncbi:MAG: hypothetical protein HPY70_08555 [Firmicutes bacterium]|nr:hypothetical protein [Bacillota bacterium]
MRNLILFFILLSLIVGAFLFADPGWKEAVFPGYTALEIKDVSYLIEGIQPSWSPDGSKVSFVSLDEDGRTSLCIMDINTKKHETLVEKGKIGYPIWSPEGDKLAFLYNWEYNDVSDTDYSSIGVYDITKGQMVIYLTDIDLKHSTLIWPQKNILLFTGYNKRNSGQDGEDGRGPKWGVWILDFTSNTWDMKTLNAPDFGYKPSISPDGKYMAYTGERFLWMSLIDGTKAKEISSRQIVSAHPVWSPDNNKVAYLAYEEGGPRIYIADVKTQESLKLVNNVEDQGYPQWSPDGKYIAYLAQDENDGKIKGYVIKSNGYGRFVIDNEIEAFAAKKGFMISAPGEKPFAWSPKGENLIMVARYQDRPYLVLVNFNRH